MNNSNNIKSALIIYIRHFQDFDMVLPFIDYVAKKNKNKLLLYSDVKSIPGAEYHYGFLREQHDMQIEYVFDQKCFRRFKKILGFRDTMLRIQRWDKYNKRARKIIIPYISFFFTTIIRAVISFLEFILQKPIKIFIDNLNISDKIIGYAGFENVFPFSTIVKLAEKRSIATIGFSRSFTCYTNLDFTGKSRINKDSFSRVDKAKNTIKKIIVNKIRGRRYYCTHYVAGRTQKKAFFQSASFHGFEKPDRVYESCTPRYTKGWCEIFRSHLLERTKFSFGAKEKLNVIFFISDLPYNVSESELINTVFELSKMENINFVYKPHPGSRLSFNKNSANCYDARDVNSILLSDWADVGIVFGSSIGVQLLLDNVPLIVPSYVHTNTTIYEKYFVCINTKSLFELKTILSNNNKNDILRLVGNKKVECFLDKYLDGSKGYDQLMLEYYEAVVNMRCSL